MEYKMPAKKSSAPLRRKPRAAGGYKKKHGLRRRRHYSGEIARLTQTIQLPDDQVNTVYRYDTCRLAAFDRAVQVAQAYQFYRIKMIELKFKPYADSYGATDPTATTAGSTIPYFYWLINKGNNMDPDNFNALRDAGSKPLRFDDKTLTVRWKPRVLMFNTSDVVGAATTPAFNPGKVSPWLNTNFLSGSASGAWQADRTAHTGILYGVEQHIPPNIGNYYGVEVTVHFEFSKPLPFGTTRSGSGGATVKQTVPADMPVHE